MRCANQYVDAPMVVDGCVNRRNAAAVLKPRDGKPLQFPIPPLSCLDAQF
jgi:hypothetical protein